MPRRRKNKRYFTKITEIAINAYNSIDDYRLKNKIYNRFIHYPFDKLSKMLFTHIKHITLMYHMMMSRLMLWRF